MAYRETAQVKARKAAQREALLRTAETLVREGGFAAMTMQTVADRAGVGVGTLYRYFDNKATLAAAVFAVATQREVDAVDRALAGGGDASARLERALRLFARRALAAPRLAWALIAEPVEPEVDAERLRYRAGCWTRAWRPASCRRSPRRWRRRPWWAPLPKRWWGRWRRP